MAQVITDKEIKEAEKHSKSAGRSMTEEELKDYYKVWSDIEKISASLKEVKTKK